MSDEAEGILQQVTQDLPTADTKAELDIRYAALADAFHQALKDRGIPLDRETLFPFCKWVRDDVRKFMDSH